jgi:hypothetical protein
MWTRIGDPNHYTLRSEIGNEAVYSKSKWLLSIILGHEDVTSLLVEGIDQNTNSAIHKVITLDTQNKILTESDAADVTRCGSKYLQYEVRPEKVRELLDKVDFTFDTKPDKFLLSTGRHGGHWLGNTSTTKLYNPFKSYTLARDLVDEATKGGSGLPSTSQEFFRKALDMPLDKSPKPR